MPEPPSRTATSSSPSQKDATIGFEGTSGPSASAPPLPTSDRYTQCEEIARGGMGVIFTALDTQLHREVAIKVLREDYQVHAIIRRRFEEEALITAQLQHPGIPPVHELGMLADGRPFLAMKLIKGRTLADILAEDRSPLSLLLEVFEKVCLTVAFAHSKCVIHRDLKPGNVMVGAFGEVQVMDWGLAKLLRPADGQSRPAEPDPEPDSAPLSVIDVPTSGTDTQAGSLLGTPAYIPPEQARGDIAATGPQSDVFSLGAILCELLTGDPPYVGSVSEVRGFAIAGHLAPALARLDACTDQPELVALAKRCLRAAPGERPGDAAAVAASVSAYRTGVEQRLRVAEVERARAEAQAVEQRKRRRTQLLLAAAVVGLLAVFGFAAWLWEKRRAEAAQREADAEADGKVRAAELVARQRATEQHVTEALAKMQSLREAGWKQADDPERWRLTLVAAGAAYEQAEALLIKGEPTDALRTRVAVESRGLAIDHEDRLLLVELDRIWEEAEASQFIPFLMNRSVVDRYEETFRKAGFDPVADPIEASASWLTRHRFRNRVTLAVRNWYHAIGNIDLITRDVAAIQAALAAPAVAGEAAIHARLMRPSRRDRLQAVLDAVTEDPFERAWWAAIRGRDTAALDRLMRSPEIEKLTPRQLGGLADGLATVRNVPGWYGMYRFLDQAYDRYPGEFWVNFRLGQRDYAEPTRRPGPVREADGLRHLTAAVAARPQSALARVALAVSLIEQGRDYETATRMFKSAAEIDPASVWPPLVSAMMSGQFGKWDVPALERAVRLDPNTAFALIGPSLVNRFALPGAPGSKADVLPVIDALITARPDHPGGYDLRGEFKMANGDARGALADFRLAESHCKGDYLRGALLRLQLQHLESIAAWEPKLQPVLRGELKLPPEDLTELAKYAAIFEKRYALATRLAAEAATADPEVLTQRGLTGAAFGFSINGALFMAWAVQAAAGKGTDAAELTDAERSRLRKQALAWGRELLARSEPTTRPVVTSILNSGPELLSVRDAKSRLLLPADERAEWVKFWSEVRQSTGKTPREAAPPPRSVEK